MKTLHSQHGWLMVEVLLASTILAFSLAAAVRWQQRSHLSAAETRERSYAMQWASSVAQCLQANAHANTSTCVSNHSQIRAGITYQLQLSNTSAGEGLTDWEITISWPPRHADIEGTATGQLHLSMRTGTTAVADGVSLP